MYSEDFYDCPKFSKPHRQLHNIICVYHMCAYHHATHAKLTYNTRKPGLPKASQLRLMSIVCYELQCIFPLIYREFSSLKETMI